MKRILYLIVVLVFFSGTGKTQNLSYTTTQIDTYLGYVAGSTAFGRTLWSLADEAAFKALVNLEIGTDVQSYDADLTTYAGITPSANVQSLMGAATYAAMRTLLDLEAGTDFYSISAADSQFLENTQLDDTKGNGDTTYIWSADKSYDQLALKLTITDIDDVPVNSETAAPISSNWAYDHENAADPHTAYYLSGDSPSFADLTLTKTLKTSQGVDVASANDMTLGDGNFFDITGTTTINTIASKGVGTFVVLQFDDALQLTHSADLFLPTAANITTAAGDIATFYEYASGDWRCIVYSRASGIPISGADAIATAFSAGVISQSKLATLVGADETFGSGWDGDTGIPEKDDIHDWAVLFDTDLDGSLDDETITPTRTALKLGQLSSAPGSPVAGDIYLADESNWDPAGLGIGKAYYVIYDGASYIPLFDEDGDWYIDKIQAAMNVIPDADGITLTASQMNSIIVMTGAGDVDIPADQCDTATGKWITVKSTAAHLNSLTSNDASDQFILSDGTALVAENELDLAGAAGNQVTVVCLQANKWWVTGEIGTCVDGGAAD